jgi:YfiH family protein
VDGGFYLSTLSNGWTVGRFRALDGIDGVTHMVTTRQALDVDLIAANHGQAAQDLARAMNLGGAAWADQVHGPTVAEANDDGCVGPADAVLTYRQDLALVMRGADCPLIFIADPIGGGVAIAHASWRSTLTRLSSRLVLHLAARVNSPVSEFVACICPSAGPCCYEVGQDVKTAVAGKLSPTVAANCLIDRGERTFMDLWQANVLDLVQAGLSEQNIHVSRVCTICSGDMFPSHRRQSGKAGRFAAVLAQTPA